VSRETGLSNRAHRGHKSVGSPRQNRAGNLPALAAVRAGCGSADGAGHPEVIPRRYPGAQPQRHSGSLGAQSLSMPAAEAEGSKQPVAGANNRQESQE
jgi:hypothetical protein